MTRVRVRAAAILLVASGGMLAFAGTSVAGTSFAGTSFAGTSVAGPSFAGTSVARSPKASTYRAGSVRLSIAFPTRETTTVVPAAKLAKRFAGLPDVVSATIFTAGIDVHTLFATSAHVPPPDAYEVTVIGFASTSTARSLLTTYGTAPGAKKRTVDGHAAYGVVGNVVTLNGGAAVPDKHATQGDLAVLDGKSVIIALVETKAASAARSFVTSLRIES